jgi:opacity protein-like surface antigen
MRLGRIWVLACWAIAAGAADTHADILAIPFVGGTFKAQTALPVLGLPIDPSTLSRTMVLGVAGMWLSPGVLGVEGELAHAPGFFEGSVLVGSNITTVTGSVVLTAPLSVTRESLRPYLVGGLGLLHVGAADRISLDPVDRNLLGLNLGGGVIGMLSDQLGVRFDIRQTRSVRDDEVTTVAFPSPQARSRVRLSYWRATVGVTIRY